MKDDNNNYNANRLRWFKEIEDSGNRVGGSWSPYTTGSYAADAVRWLTSVFNVRTMIDLGCGCGETLRSFRSYGVQAIGIEFHPSPIKICNMPVIMHDMESGPLIMKGIDLVWSMEFVEHCNNVSATIDTLCNGKIIAMSHAVPGQAGEHHVQCHDREFWIDKIKEKDYVYLEELSDHLRTQAHGTYMSSTGIMFCRRENMAELGLDQGCYWYQDGEIRKK